MLWQVRAGRFRPDDPRGERFHDSWTGDQEEEGSGIQEVSSDEESSNPASEDAEEEPSAALTKVEADLASVNLPDERLFRYSTGKIHKGRLNAPHVTACGRALTDNHVLLASGSEPLDESEDKCLRCFAVAR